MGKQKFFGQILRNLSFIVLSWSLIDSYAGVDDEGEQLPRSLQRRVMLPHLPDATEKMVPVELVEFEQLPSDSDAWTLHVVDPRGLFRLDPIPKKQSMWVLQSGRDSEKPAVAKLAIRKQRLLFVWNRNRATEATRENLKQCKLIVKDDENNLLECSLGPKRIVGTHHGYDRTHETPHFVSHEYKVSDLATRARLKLKIQSPYPVKLMEKNEKQRTVTARKWLKVPFRFEEENLKRVKIGMHWMVERPRKSKKTPTTMVIKLS